MSEHREADVAVVGAGFAGLAAARAIAAAGYSAVVLEARSRVGGRVLNQDIGAGKVVEAGGSGSAPPRTGCTSWPRSSRSTRSTATTPATLSLQAGSGPGSPVSSPGPTHSLWPT